MIVRVRVPPSAPFLLSFSVIESVAPRRPGPEVRILLVRCFMNEYNVLYGAFAQILWLRRSIWVACFRSASVGWTSKDYSTVAGDGKVSEIMIRELPANCVLRPLESRELTEYGYVQMLGFPPFSISLLDAKMTSTVNLGRLKVILNSGRAVDLKLEGLRVVER